MQPRVLNRAIIKTTPEGSVYVGRPSKWGNPFVLGKDGTRDEVVSKYRQMLADNPDLAREVKQELRGKNLVCWCAPLPCHADVLLEIANQSATELNPVTYATDAEVMEDQREYGNLRLAIGSLLDIVSELVIALEQGHRPDEAYTDTVTAVIKNHKRELGFE